MNIIDRAAAGDQSSAWALIHQLETALKARRISESLFDHAAEFFGALLDIHDKKDGRATRDDLAVAFDKLHIVHPRKQPNRSAEEKMKLAARVALLASAGFKANKALDALGALKIHARKAYRTAYEEWGQRLVTHSIIEELETLAEVSIDDLLSNLVKSGVITPAKKESALKTLLECRAESVPQRELSDEVRAGIAKKSTD